MRDEILKAGRSAWSSETIRPEGARRSQTNALGGTVSRRSFGGLVHQSGARNVHRPTNFVWPMLRKPGYNLVILLCSESPSVANARKEAAVCGAVPTNSRFAKLSCFGELIAKCQEVTCQFRFHNTSIVGHIPLCNRKHPISAGRGKFPILPL